MTVALELAKGAQSIEYILCIEGIGWPTTDGNPGDGFDGDVFVTADLNGDLATQLDCTIHKTLLLPESTGDSIDHLTLVYSVDGMNFQIVDSDSFCLQNITPQKTGYDTTLNTALGYSDTSVVLADGTNFATGAKCWLGAECVLLGTKSGGGAPHTYTSSTRGYLGTPRGRRDLRVPSSTTLRQEWPATSTVAYSLNRYYYDRRVRLYMHVPAETDSGCVLVWSGVLRSITNPRSAGVWEIECSGGHMDGIATEIFTPAGWSATSPAGVYAQTPSSAIGEDVAAGTYQRIKLKYTDVVGYSKTLSAWGLHMFYHYRTEPGGTAGAINQGVATTTPQARTIGVDTYCLGGYMSVNGKIIRAVKKQIAEAGTGVASPLTDIIGFLKAQDVYHLFDHQDVGGDCKFLIDSVSDSYEINRFAKNKKVSRHPIDVLLAFMTSMPDEFYIGDATGGTTTNITFSGLGADNLWDGYALFCVEGNNKDTCRLIDSSTTTLVKVYTPFDNAPTVGTEYQIRNSIYDTLPCGWGLGIHNARIDIESFEEVRDTWIPNATLGKFIFGAEDKIKLWEFIRDNICVPFNILVYKARSTGKITAKYIGEIMQSGLSEDYTSLTTDDFIDWGTLNYNVTKPVGNIEIATRPTELVVTSAVATYDYGTLFGYNIGSGTIPNLSALAVGPGDGKSIQIINVVPDEVASAYPQSGLSTIKISALLNSLNDIEGVVTEGIARCKRNALPPATVSVTVAIKHILTLQSGSFVRLTFGTYPTDPLNGDRGLSTQDAVILGTKLDFKNGTMQLHCQLAPNLTFGKIAPAANISSKGSDGSGDYIVCNRNDFIPETDSDLNTDLMYFAYGQRLVLRDVYGVEQEDLGAIIGFGSAGLRGTTPIVADTRIYFTAGIARVIASGDYATFDNWDGTVSGISAMNLYSAYGDSSGALTGGATSKVYA